MNAETTVKHKFLEGSNMTFQEVFDFAYHCFPVWQDLAKELGEDHFLEALEKVAFEAALKAGQDTACILPCNDFAAFTALERKPSYFDEHVLTFEIIEDTPQAFEVKITECLWAKTFRKMGMSKMGYLLICYPDYARCQGFNPRIGSFAHFWSGLTQ